jgi:2,4-dienoyl-CoA reductase-like NADH-dependent reductase (Old Yellow Enzyme family)
MFSAAHTILGADIMSKLFDSGIINGMALSNRFVRAATWEGMADAAGAPTHKLIKAMTALAEGGVGLIITSHCYVSPEGQASVAQICMHKDEIIESLRDLTASVHGTGGKIVAQLSHAGNFADEKLLGRPPVVASDFEGLARTPRREMTRQDIQEVVSAFVKAALRAKSAGFDGVQIHGAHGFLLSEFLSPAYNRRRDAYGGPIENRARFILEVCKSVRDAVGLNYPILVKINCQDFIANGLTLEDSIKTTSLLAEAGLDAVEVSGGMLTERRLSPVRAGIDCMEKEAYFQEEARAFRKRIHIPLILLGGIRSFDLAERLVEEGTADYISMSRPFIREPGLINRWKSGDRRKAQCLSDNRCIMAGREGNGIYCHNEKE